MPSHFGTWDTSAPGASEAAMKTDFFKQVEAVAGGAAPHPDILIRINRQLFLYR